MSPCYVRILTPEGLQPVNYTADSLAEAAEHEPDDGIYTVTNTYNTFQTLKLDAHLDRLEDSAQRVGMSLKMDRKRLRRALRKMIAEAGYGDVRFRITIPRERPNHFILSLEPFKPIAPELIVSGVRCVTTSIYARQNPAAKSAAWLHTRKQILDSMPPGIYEIILLDSGGHLLEGLGSNFYAILDGELRTAGEGVLAGVAQQIVFTVSPDILPVRREVIHISDVPQLEEAFITSSSRGIVPVVEIDGQRIGDGEPGPQTMALRSAYNAWVSDHLEEL